MAQKNGLRLVLLPLPLQGHLNPMLQLADILHSKGFSISIIHTSFNSPNPSNYPHLIFCCIQDCLTESESSTLDPLQLVIRLNIKCVTPFREMLAKVLSDVSDEPIACLISDALFYFTQGVANNFKLPRIVLRTTGVPSFVPFVLFPLLIERGYLPIKESQLEEAVTELPPLKVKDLPMMYTKESDKIDNFIKTVSSLVNETKASSGLIWNTFEELEPSALSYLNKEFDIPFFPIGPFHKYYPTASSPSSSSSSSLLAQDQSCISWLDKHKPQSVLYVSFGSLAAITETQFLDIAWGLGNSNVPFLWVVRPGMILGSEWLEPLPRGFVENLDGRGHIVKWAPQQEVLAHSAVGAFWTHSGWNSTLESICEGVPMICMPCFTDQKVNARYVSHVWKIGVQFERGVEREEIVKMIRILMEEREGVEIRDRILSLKEKVKLCWRQQGGSSYSSLDGLVNFILSLEPNK
ncbi:hypothetical protein RIF29_17474 [Crotalaria pallida]|uniref:Uncharacterized protein n=1 Tax=Crotalaria pallida TaxID=3830 RepID=A0AAN9FI72_CROPI